MASKRTTVYLFVLYFLLLTWIIVFKMDIGSTFYRAQFAAYRSLNVVPLAGTAVYDGYLDYPEIFLNVILFLPMGIYLPLLFEKQPKYSLFLGIVGVSLFYEVIQYVFAIGVADITDLLANTLGGLLGLLIFFRIQAYFKEQIVHLVNTVAFWTTVSALIFLLFWQFFFSA